MAIKTASDLVVDVTRHPLPDAVKCNPDAAEHLMKLYLWLGRHRVELWTVQSGKIDRLRW